VALAIFEMIRYERGGLYFVLKVFQRRGSVFGTSFRIALPCAIMTLCLKLFSDWRYIPFLDGPRSILTDNGVWSGFSFLVGFLIVFRTSQAYARFWDGCTSTHLMRAEWYDACSAVVAFCRHSKVDEEIIAVFQHTVVRLFSMMHALALAEIEDSNSDDVKDIAAFRYELIDAESIDPDSLRYIRDSDSKVELVYQWIQHLLVDNIDTGILSIPAPLLSRVFQEINDGMIQFHQAIKISTIPFPFPYAQTCDCLLIMHYLTTPFVLSQWVSHPVWAFVFAFMQVSILWSLNCIAVEIENPFGQDDNDIDAASMQAEMNRHLSVLLLPASKRTPKIHHSTIEDIVYSDAGSSAPRATRRTSFNDIWQTLELGPKGDCIEVARSARRGSIISASSVRSATSTVRSSRPSGPTPRRSRERPGSRPGSRTEAAPGLAPALAPSQEAPRRQSSGVAGRDRVRWAPTLPLQGKVPRGDLEPAPTQEPERLRSRTASLGTVTGTGQSRPSRASTADSSRGPPDGTSSSAPRQSHSSSAARQSCTAAELGDASAPAEGGEGIRVLVECAGEVEDRSGLVEAPAVAAPRSATLANHTDQCDQRV